MARTGSIRHIRKEAMSSVRVIKTMRSSTSDSSQ